MFLCLLLLILIIIIIIIINYYLSNCDVIRLQPEVCHCNTFTGKGDLKNIKKWREKKIKLAQSTVVVLHETIPCLFFRCDKMARERLKLGKKRTIRMGVLFFVCECVINMHV